MRAWIAAALALQGAFAGRVPPDDEKDPSCFAVTVVDEQTGRGVPLVELRTVNEIRCHTDSNGVAAFREPGLMNRRVFFSVKSHGYEFPADGFGSRGAALEVKPGGQATLKIRRLNIAERLYRVTGQGIYRDSLLAGRPVPLKNPALNGQVLGQDSVQMVEYRGRLHWFWGDTNRPSYPLGHFGTAGATSARPGDGGLDPSKGIDLAYFTDATGFSRPMCALPEPGMKWIDGVAVVPDAEGKDRLVARFARMKSLGEAYERGILAWNDGTDSLEPVSRSGPHEFPWPCCHAFRHQDHVYFATPYPYVRVKADLKSFADPRAYEAFTPLAAGGRYRKGAAALERGADGRAAWSWKKDTGPVWENQEKELLAAGQVRPEEARYRLADAGTGKRVAAHNGSVAYNAFRRRWIMILNESGGGPSYLGEVWYSEAEAPEGPWLRARKVVTHDKYTFYNVKHHPLFDQEGGRVIYFEGTYTAQFSGNPDPTPRYDYNQVMYRLDLSDPRLKMDTDR